MAKRAINESSHNSSDSGTGGQSLEKDIPLIVNEAVEKAVKPIRDDLNDYKVKIIEVLAIFVALFTFVSVDIQIFKSDISTLSAAGFTLIMLSGLVIFVVALAYMLDDRVNGVKLLYTIISSVVVGAIGVYIVGINYNGIEATLNEKFYTKEQSYSKEEANQNFYSKEDLKNVIEENTKDKQILDCLKNKEYFSIKCFQ